METPYPSMSSQPPMANATSPISNSSNVENEGEDWGSESSSESAKFDINNEGEDWGSEPANVDNEGEDWSISGDDAVDNSGEEWSKPEPTREPTPKIPTPEPTPDPTIDLLSLLEDAKKTMFCE